MNYAFSPKGPCMTLFITFCLFFKQKLKKYVVLVLYFGKQLVLSFHVIGCVRDLGGLFKHAASFLLELSTQLDPALSLRPRRVGHHSSKPE